MRAKEFLSDSHAHKVVADKLASKNPIKIPTPQERREQIAKREAEKSAKTAKAQQSKDSFDSMFGGGNPAKGLGIREGAKALSNFTPDDIKELEGIRDLATLKARAFALISKPSARPMKPEKVQWFKNALQRMVSRNAVIKLMWDLYLSGEGQGVVGSRNSMSANSYRGRFAESGNDNTFMGTVKNKKTGVEFDVKAASPANRVGERESNLIYLIDKTTGKPAHKFMSSKEIEKYYDWVKFPGRFSEAKAPATDLKVGDHVVADTSKEQYPGGHTSRSGKVTRVGQTGVHIQPDDGGEREYHPYKIVKKSNG